MVVHSLPAPVLAETAPDWKAKMVTVSEHVDLLGGRDVPLTAKVLNMAANGTAIA
jgi:hypothetical protein